ncbi:DEAD/DEAH box helicase [Neobacillus sp. LXY-4]|uniref:DEAD/DEAH box helicase n=1 Tax=Neobacillus sp. LXY-4 TaxID=3379826 RepID=UPI003EE120FE
MLKSRYVKIHLFPLDAGRYFLKAEKDTGEIVPVSVWKKLLFFHHEESFFGTMVESSFVDGEEGVVLNGWDLVTLFAKEPFNRFIEWDWDDLSQASMAAAPAIYEAVMERDWLPDFSAWEEESAFRWALPERVVSEFGPGFWDQRVGDGGTVLVSPDVAAAGAVLGSQSVDEAEGDFGDTRTVPMLHFIGDWFNGALDAYLARNEAMKALFGEKLAHLREQGVSAKALAHFFDEESWLQWIGLKDDPTPFTIGLQLEEPAEADQEWSLNVFLRGKAADEADFVVRIDDPVDLETGMRVVEEDGIPLKWRPFLGKVAVEEARWVGLFPWLAGRGRAQRLTSRLTEFEAWEFLTEASETLVALGVEILLPAWWQAMKNTNLKVKARVKGSSTRGPSYVGLQALLDYDWRFSMNGVELSESEFQQMVEEKRRLVYVRGRWIKLDPQFIRQIQDLMKKADKQGLHVRDLLEQELLADEAASDEDELDNPKAFARIQIELNRQWKQMVRQLNEVKEIPLEPVPVGFKGELRPYQQLGMSWLWFLRQTGFGAILADDMGLGKTVQLLSYLLLIKERSAGAGSGSAGPALIICPTSVLGNWQKEIERFAPGTRVYLHYGAGRLKGEEFRARAESVDIVLSSYGLTHLDFEEFEGLTWSAIAIDEAQNIKNAATKQSRAVRKLRGQHHIALTGTPMENRLSELWSIFDFTNHGYLGGLTQFQKRFVAPIEKDGDKAVVERLQALIRPFLLRRTKKDQEVALNLPDKLEQKEYCPLTAEQASLYEQLVKDTFAEIESLSGFERKGLILQMLGRLKQLCNHPALYLKEVKPRGVLERSAKMEKLVELVDAVVARGESCLIFTQYIEMGEMIRGLLRGRLGLDVPFLNGSVPKQQRDVMIERFQDREFPVFLLSLKAGGTGLNLTAANHVIHYDRWWNPAVENQATDRAYRIGQDRFVHVHKLISTGTLEEKIDAMLEKKQSLNEQIIQSESWITELGDRELEELLTLG